MCLCFVPGRTGALKAVPEGLQVLPLRRRQGLLRRSARLALKLHSALRSVLGGGFAIMHRGLLLARDPRFSAFALTNGLSLAVCPHLDLDLLRSLGKRERRFLREGLKAAFVESRVPHIALRITRPSRQRDECFEGACCVVVPLIRVRKGGHNLAPGMRCGKILTTPRSAVGWARRAPGRVRLSLMSQ